MAEAIIATIPSGGIQYPISVDKKPLPPLPAAPAPSYIHTQNPISTKTHFPPLQLEQDGSNTPPLFFPLVPTHTKPSRRCLKTSEGLRAARLQGSKGKQALQETPQSDKPEDYEECVNARNSWSYWTGAKGRNGHLNKQLQYQESLQHIQVTDGQPGMGLETINAPEVSHAEFIGCGHSQKHLRQVTEGKQVSLTGSPVSPRDANPSGNFPTSLVPAAYPPQQEGEPEYLHPQNKSNRRSYSLKMSSHPPIHLAQPTSPAEYQRRVSSLAKRFDTTGSSRPLHQVNSAPPSDAVRLPVKSSRRRPANIAGMKEYEEFLLSPLSGREATGNLYQQLSATGHGLKPLLSCNTYQPLVSKSTPRRYNTSSFNSSHSTNFSYPRVYSDFPGPKRRNTIGCTMRNSSRYQIGSVTPLSNNVENSSDEYETYRGISRTRSLSEGSREVIPKGFRARFASLHPERTIERAQTFGGTNTDKHALISQKESGKARSNFFIPDQPAASPVRSGSYRSVIVPRDRINSTDFGIPTIRSISWGSSRMGLDGEVYDNILTATTRTGYAYCNMQTPPVEDRRRTGDISFTSTIVVAPRSYTPDNFIAEEGVTHNDCTVVRSVKSWMSIHQHRGRKSVASTRSLDLRTISRSSSADRNTLVKQNGTYSVWPYTEKVKVRPREDSPSSPPASSATIGLGILGAFKKQKKVAKELKDTTKHPHTATTRAGPVNIEEDQPPPLRSGVYQPNPMQTQPNYLAKEGKAKYEYAAWDIRDLLARENARNMESERRSRIDALEQLSCPPTGKNTINSKHTKGESSSNGTPGDTSQYGTSRNSLTPYAPRTMGPGTVRVVSPTSPGGFLYISTTYGESQNIFAKIRKNGLRSSFSKLKIKKDIQKTQGKKVKVYMKGARTDSLTILEKIGRKIGIDNPIVGWGRKNKGSVEAGGKSEQNATMVGDNENDPSRINFCGADGITEGRKEHVEPKRLVNPYGFCDPDWDCSFPRAIWKEFEQGPLVDPVKEKLEAKSSDKLWSSKKEVKAETSMWARFRKLACRKPDEPGPLKVIDVKGKGKAFVC